ncbi:MAG: ribosome biogenesis GTPase Der [Coprobacillus sp.]|nr:ribosome biogenesis GTPase Der [Coprobacillus sp.]
MASRLPLVAIVGAPNVGKSTIFNRLLGERRAIVDDTPGITRDRLYGIMEWRGHQFSLVDTGGIELSDAPFQKQIRMQAEVAIDEADVIVFVVDGILGPTSDDREVARILKDSGKPIIFCVNKVDDVIHIGLAHEFYSLSLGEPIAISSLHGVGIGDLLDKIVSLLPQLEEVESPQGTVFCIIGRPNVGKSSLANAILNEERVIVSDISGTTRDAIDTYFEKDGQKYTVIDTAGLKKKGKIYESIDKYSAIRALRAIERSEIVLLVIDGHEGIVDQDKHIISYATDLKKAIIIVVNKWDLVEKDENTMSEFTKKVRNEYKFLGYAPIVFVSALKGSRLNTLFDALKMVNEAYHTRVTTGLLNTVIHEATRLNEPPHFNGGRIKVLYATQVSTAPPTIVLSVNNPEWMHFSYIRYLENQLRQAFNFDGTPIRFVLKKRGKQDD